MVDDEYIVILEPGVFLSDGEGDPPRVTDLKNAKIFGSMKEAIVGLGKARKFRPFLKAEILLMSVD